MAYTAWSVVFGEQPSTAKWNILGTNDAGFRDGTNISSGVITPEKLTTGAGTSWTWSTWSPTWTSVTVGNGTVVSVYSQVGKIVFCQLSFKLGSTSAISGQPIFTLPITSTALVDTANVPFLGTVNISDDGTAQYLAAVHHRSTTEGIIQFADDAAAGVRSDSAISSTTPMTWTTNDAFSTFFFYRAA